LTSLPELQTPDEDAGIAAVREAHRLGINFFDTAPFYGSGSAEQVGAVSESAITTITVVQLSFHLHDVYC